MEEGKKDAGSRGEGGACGNATKGTVTEVEDSRRRMSQTSFGHISIKSLTIPTVSKPA